MLDYLKPMLLFFGAMFLLIWLMDGGKHRATGPQPENCSELASRLMAQRMKGIGMTDGDKLQLDVCGDALARAWTHKSVATA